MQNLTRLPCEGRETVSHRPLAQAKHNKIKYGKEYTVVDAIRNGKKH